MNAIREFSEKEKLGHAKIMLQNAHMLLGVQCQNCGYYQPYKEDGIYNGYKGKCSYNDWETYWNQYCDDFDEVKDDIN